MADVNAAAKEAIPPVFSLAALPSLAENSRLGLQLPTPALHPGFGLAISNTATGFGHPAYDFCTRSCSPTYFRDAETGLDYAKNRYHQPGAGRFMTPDPYQASGGPGDPGSWNRYLYASGDPINGRDPSGLKTCFYVDGQLDSCEEDDDPDVRGPRDGAVRCDEERTPTPGCRPTVDAGGGPSGSMSYAQAAGSWTNARKWIDTHSFKKGCADVMQALGIGEDTWRNAIDAMQFNDGTTSSYRMADLFAGGAIPSIIESGSTYGDQTVSQYIAQQAKADKPVGAVAALGAGVVFLNYAAINPGDLYGNSANIMHEALHNALGLTDPFLQNRLAKFGAKVGAPSSNISDIIKNKCL